MNERLTLYLPETESNILFCNGLVENINKDFPSAARVETTNKGIYVAITTSYREKCEKYVLDNCKIKTMDYRGRKSYSNKNEIPPEYKNNGSKSGNRFMSTQQCFNGA
jgi:hypothetical protein